MDPSKPQETIIASPIPSSLPSQVSEPTKKSIWKRWTTWLVIILILIIVIPLILFGIFLYKFPSARSHPETIFLNFGMFSQKQ